MTTKIYEPTILERLLVEQLKDMRKIYDKFYKNNSIHDLMDKFYKNNSITEFYKQIWKNNKLD